MVRAEISRIRLALRFWRQCRSWRTAWELATIMVKGWGGKRNLEVIR